MKAYVGQTRSRALTAELEQHGTAAPVSSAREESHRRQPHTRTSAASGRPSDEPPSSAAQRAG
jgi:hypothetical protein